MHSLVEIIDEKQAAGVKPITYRHRTFGESEGDPVPGLILRAGWQDILEVRFSDGSHWNHEYGYREPVIQHTHTGINTGE